jgi:hypothetical protein
MGTAPAVDQRAVLDVRETQTSMIVLGIGAIVTSAMLVNRLAGPHSLGARTSCR